MELVITMRRTLPLVSFANGLAAIFCWIDSGVNWSREIGPMMPRPLREGTR